MTTACEAYPAAGSGFWSELPMGCPGENQSPFTCAQKAKAEREPARWVCEVPSLTGHTEPATAARKRTGRVLGGRTGRRFPG